MNSRKLGYAAVIFTGTMVCIVNTARADSGQKTITNGTCTGLDNSTIPVGNFYPPAHLPEADLHIKQKYNTTYAEGYTLNGIRYYGHDGLDVDGTSQNPGVNDVKAIQPGIVVLSQDEKSTGGKKGWGESIIIATRANEFSDEIITHHYHHLYANKTGTTRLFNACDAVNTGDPLGREDDTGNSHGSHLHQGIRRWHNLAELTDALKKGGAAIFGYGYTFGDDKKLAKNLDPEGLLFDTFRDYQLDANGNPPAFNWSLPFVQDMRRRGIDLGMFDGRFGAGENVKRRDAARWLKIAARQLDATPANATFTDIPATDPDFPYVEALIAFPSQYPVINQNAGISGGLKYFHPEDALNRAAALKMVILSFYSSEFLEVYDNSIWKATNAAAIQLLNKFQDVDPNAWYAPYVYFGAQKGLVATQPNFYPANNIKKEEMAKWISAGADQADQDANAPGACPTCPADNFCDLTTEQCHPIPTCIPTETQHCDPGGGDTGNDPCAVNPMCTAGLTDEQGCFVNGGIPGTQTRTCDASCTWGAWTTCVTTGVCIPGETVGCGNCGTSTCDDSGQWAWCFNEGPCQPGQTNQQTCNGTGTQTQTCQNSCAWGSWSTCSVNPVCSAGQTQQQSCTTFNNLPGLQTRTCDAYGQWGAWGSCVQSCTDTFLASASPACYTTPNGPTLCLSVQQVNGATWQYQVCKQGGTFINNFAIDLRDDNHYMLLDSVSGNAGVSCSPWHSFSVSYINGYGPSNGAGLRAQVLSPANCQQSSCTYSTGTVTVRKECQ